MPDFAYRFEPAQDSNAPPLVLLHGTGGDENDLIRLGRDLAPGAALLSPRGKVLENGMPRYFRRLAEGVFDLEDVRFRAHELGSFVERAADQQELDPGRLVAVGYSNGANVAAAILLLRPRVFSAAVLFRAMPTIDPENPPRLRSKKVYLSQGQQDPVVNPIEALRLAKILENAGAEVTVHWTHGGHEIEPGELAEAQRFISGFYAGRGQAAV